jgi:TetR/AcrR family transcriptional repressor of multidrug resistance operon
MIVQSDILDKKEAILRSTLELIMDHGFHGTPISLITKHAGVAAGTIYHYFPSKDAIILELHSLIRDEIAAAMFLDNPDNGDFKKQFFDGWINLCQYFINNPASLFFIEQFNSSPYAKEVAKKDKKNSLNKFSQFFQYGIDNGYLKELEYKLIASTVFGCIIATAKYHISGQFGFKDNDLGKIATILWDGIKAR